MAPFMKRTQPVELFRYERIALKTVGKCFYLIGGENPPFFRSNVRSLESWENWVSHPEVHQTFLYAKV